MSSRPITAITLVALLVSGAADAQDVRERIDADTFFDAEPAWLVNLRLGLGIESQDAELFPNIEVLFAYHLASHALIGGLLGVRPTDRQHVRLGPRFGVFFEQADLAFGTGVSPGLLVRFNPQELGLVVTWGSEIRYRLNKHNYLNLFGEIDLLFEVLGFRETGQLYTVGLGWVHRF